VDENIETMGATEIVVMGKDRATIAGQAHVKCKYVSTGATTSLDGCQAVFRLLTCRTSMTYDEHGDSIALHLVFIMRCHGLSSRNRKHPSRGKFVQPPTDEPAPWLDVADTANCPSGDV
jgi:hypothetical protein